MWHIYWVESDESGRDPRTFKQMLERFGELKTARKLLAAPNCQYDFKRLQQPGRLDLTVEALVVKPEYAPLFSP